MLNRKALIQALAGKTPKEVEQILAKNNLFPQRRTGWVVPTTNGTGAFFPTLEAAAEYAVAHTVKLPLEFFHVSETLEGDKNDN